MSSFGVEPAHLGLALVAAACFGFVCALAQATDSGASFAEDNAVATIPYFGDCPSGGGRNCVVSGDTFDVAGQKFRIAGIDAPQILASRCDAEERRGKVAAQRLRELLNSGAMSLETVGGLASVSGPVLRVVRIDGRNIGATMITEGLAVSYGAVRPWCVTPDRRQLPV